MVVFDAQISVFGAAVPSARCGQVGRVPATAHGGSCGWRGGGGRLLPLDAGKRHHGPGLRRRRKVKAFFRVGGRDDRSVSRVCMLYAFCFFVVHLILLASSTRGKLVYHYVCIQIFFVVIVPFFPAQLERGFIYP